MTRTEQPSPTPRKVEFMLPDPYEGGWQPSVDDLADVVWALDPGDRARLIQRLGLPALADSARSSEAGGRTGSLPPTDDPEGQAMAFRTFGEQIAEIGLREIAEDRSLNADEVQAVVYLARALLQWCGSATGPLDVDALDEACRWRFGTWDRKDSIAITARLASQSSGASDE